MEPDSTAPQDDLSGQTHGDFEIVRRLGQGGMGQVFLAEQLSLKRKVALKFLKPELAVNPTARSRFRAEAEAVAKISHPNIVQVYTVGELVGMPFMALEYVQGITLRDYLSRKGAPDLARALLVMRQVAAALQRAGEIGIVHRDIKPENILLTRKGEVKVTDFGLSRVFGLEQKLSLTQTGITMGTPLYMSPEQAQGKPVDPRSDIYSFGVTCYQLLAGRPPFTGQNAVEVALKHVNEVPPPLAAARPDLPPELIQLVERMMHKDPAARPQTGREILRDLNLLRTQPNDNPFGDLVPPSATRPTTAIMPTPPVIPTSKKIVPPKRTWSGRFPFKLAGAIVLAFVMGAAGRMVIAPARPSTPKAAVPNPEPSEYERFLLSTVRQFATADLNAPPKQQAAMKVNVALAVLYLDQRRYLDAEALALKLRAQDSNPSLKFVGNLVQGLIYAFQDEPDKSIKTFQLAMADKNANRYLNLLLNQPSHEAVDLRAFLLEALERDEQSVKLPQDMLRLKNESRDALRKKPGVPFGKKGIN